jgi:hypothetical protein
MTYPQGPQQPYGGYPQQQPGYPPQQGYPQQPGGGYPGYPPPPRKKNTGLIVALSAVGAAAVIAVVLVLVLSGKDDSSPSADNTGNGKPDVSVPGPNVGGGKNTGGSKPSGGSTGGSTGARELAEQAVDIINSHNPSGMEGLTCDSNATKELTNAMGTLPSSATATLGDVKEQGTYAQAMIKINVSGKAQTVSLEMSKHGSKWCAAGL